MSLFNKIKLKISEAFSGSSQPLKQAAVLTRAKGHIVHPDGSEEWFVEARQSREPAVIHFEDGQQFTGEQWAERQQQKIDNSIAAMRGGLSGSMTVGHALRLRGTEQV
jgi:hypothetical protein